MNNSNEATIALTEAMPEGTASAQFLREINFKLDLIPRLIEATEKTLPEVLVKVTSVESQFSSLNQKLSENVKACEEMKGEIEMLRKNLRAATMRADAFDEELRRCNVVLYNFEPINPAIYTLKQEIIMVLNKCIPDLNLNRCDVKDVFRMRAGPVLLKMNSVEFRGIILKSNPLLKRNGLSAAPDYSARQREARKNLKPVLEYALSKHHQARLRGEKLYIDGRVFVYDFPSECVKEVTTSSSEVNKQGPPRTGSAETREVELAKEPASEKTDISVAGRVVSESSESDSQAESDIETVIEFNIRDPKPNFSKGAPRPVRNSPIAAKNTEKRKAWEVISPDDQNRIDARNVARKDSRSGGGRANYRGQSRSTRAASSKDYYRLSYLPDEPETPFVLPTHDQLVLSE